MHEINEKVSESHRKQPNKRWMGSYTQRIVGGLQRWQLGRSKFRLSKHFPRSWFDDTLDRAVELLKDYHDTMHVVYEERDRARRELATCVNAFSHKDLPVDHVDGMVVRANGLRYAWCKDKWLYLGVDTTGEYYADQAGVIQNLRGKLKLAEGERDQVTKSMNEYREMFFKAVGERETARKSGDEARAAVEYAQTELRMCKGQLADSQKFGDNFKRLLKSNLREALVKSGAL